MKDNKFRFRELKERIMRMSRELPVILAVKTQNHFVGHFNKQGFEGKPWPLPQRKQKGTLAYKYSKYRGKPILVNRGRLRSAVGSSIRSKNFQLIRLVVDLPYAKRHNEGLNGMPARPFMKDSRVLRRMQRDEINKYMKKLWRK